MKTNIILSIVASLAINAMASTVVLDGHKVTSDQIVNIANGSKVDIDKSSLDRVVESHNFLMEAAKTGHKIYGLTVGVGLNKDRKMVDTNGQLSDEVLKASRDFNLGLIRAHAGSVGPVMDVKTARAVLAVRLNNMLYGSTGVQKEVVELYKEFLNRDIIPVMPTKGSMGEADITILAAVGTAMIGEGEVFYHGERMPAAEALKKANIKPLSPVGKDSLSIISSNAYSAALAAIALEDMKRISKVSKYVYALSLEAFNGNVNPFLEETIKIHPMPGSISASKEVREILKGSSLWDADPKRPLQDPLSFRDAVHLMGAFDMAYADVNKLMNIQFNSSDDNPGISLDAKKTGTSYQETSTYVNGKSSGALLRTSNFEPIPWVIEFEKVSIALAHNSLASAHRTIKLSDDTFTGLTRFLGTENSVHAFGAMQKPFVALAGENQFLANPASLAYIPVAGNIEDIATNAPQVVKKVQTQLDNQYDILGMELIHAAQAIDLRMKQNPNLKLSPETEKMYKEYRKVVKFLDADRPLTDDFKKSSDFLRSYTF